MRERGILKVMTASVLVGVMLTGTLSGCSLFEEKKKKTASGGDREVIWPYATTETTEPETSILPEVDLTRPTMEDAKPITEATEPTTEATEPTTEATEPTTELTEPTTELTEPTTEPTETTSGEVFPDEIIHPMYGHGEITASVLNIREYPGMDYEVLDGLKRGTRVEIYNQVLVDGEYWGEIDQGWINMQWVAMDGDVVGTWYQPLGYDNTTGESVYVFWTLELTGEFRYVVYGFGVDQVRQISRSGGTFQMDEVRISFDFTYGGGDIMFAGITTEVPGNVTCYWDVYGKTMTLKEVSKSVLTRGTVEKLWEQLQEED